ncbi:MAG: cytochrome P450 [Myxococcota bacterium]
MVEYNPYDWKIHEDPYPTYAALRNEAPVYYNEEIDFWALSRHADVLAAFRDPVRYSNEYGVSLEKEQIREARAVMSFLAMDPPDHTRVRALVNRGFSPRRVTELEPKIRALANRYIDAFIDDGECDFIDAFAGRLPMDVISEMLGVAEADRDDLRGWADLVLHREPGNPNVPPAGMAAAARILKYFAEFVKERRAAPGDGLTDALISAEIEGDQLADSDIIAFLFLMIIAGNETTTKLLANALYWLWKHPAQRDVVRTDPNTIGNWGEETLRFDPSSQLIARTTTTEIEIHDQKIPAGARVALLIGSGNRDERAWDRPDEYDIRRDTRNSLSFGQGTHFCLGASLARLETRVSLEQLHHRIPDFEIRPDGMMRMHSSNVRGFAVLPIEFGR